MQSKMGMSASRAAERKMPAAEEFCRQGELYVRLLQKRFVVEVKHQGRRPVTFELDHH
jgi:hypothetical protein